MPRFAFLPLILFLLLPALPAQAAPEVSIELLAIDPGGRSALPLRATLYGRIRYSTDRPARLVLTPYRDGREVRAGRFTSLSPTYPAGSGEALAWFAFGSPQRIDEVRAQATDGNGAVFAEARLRRPLDWYAGAGAVPPPASWVQPLRQASKALRAESRGESGDSAVGLVLTGGLFYLVPLSVLLQVAAWRKLEGVYGFPARCSAFAMAALWLFVIVTGLAGSNLSPIWLVFLSPLFILFLGALFLMQYLGRRGPA